MNFFCSNSRHSVTSGEPVMKDGSLYFAYGSNLHLTQMASRCPASVFKGKAVLSGYRWQINQRGVANVVKSIDDYIEGLLYLVNPKDERSLDRSEGVAKGFYQKHILVVNFEPHRQFENHMSSEVAQLISQPAASKAATSSKSEGGGDVKNFTDQIAAETTLGRIKKQKELKSTRNVKALVYVSENYTEDGTIREEYILRLQKAILDAEILGITRSFVIKYITPFMNRRNEFLPAPGHADTGWYTSGSFGNKGSTMIGSKTMKVYEKDQGKMVPEKSQFQSSEGNTDPLDCVDFQELRRANRDPHIDSGLKFPTIMLDVIKSKSSGAMRDTIIYTVAANEENVDSTPHFDILAVSMDLELANELAIKHFRDMCSQSIPYITDETREQWEGPKRADIQTQVFSWKFNQDAYIQLDATLPSSNHRITVQVIARKLLARS
ncbi:hypothetical protein F4680DRAFT_87392 [Xylaria scruposa]|nr:hypothetical protein F4680DRAFT_87392 [Xylaria scruposa]